MKNLSKVKVLRFPDLQTGWEGINEYLFIENDDIESMGGGLNGPMQTAYDQYVIMDRAKIDKNYDFGIQLGYNIRKWSSLVNNYLDINYLDMVKAEINKKESQGNRSYNHTLHFDNSHGSGKDCLVSLTFSKRINRDTPVVIFTIRTSEVTKRLLWDFLLVQRIIEYIYGHNKMEVHFHAPSYYITAESFVMYNNTKDIEKLLPRKKAKSKFQQKVYTIFDEYMNHPNPESVIYRVHRRSIMQIQHGTDGLPISGVKSLKAKECKLEDVYKGYPKDVITKQQRKKHEAV